MPGVSARASANKNKNCEVGQCAKFPELVSEALNFSVNVDYKQIKCPILAFGAENDALVPADYVRVVANLSGAKFHFLKGRGHNILLEPNWRETATVIGEWLASIWNDRWWPPIQIS